MKNDNKARIISVQASAGSGKTYNLAKRYIHLLLDCGGSRDHSGLRNIIAVTFANKAAVEMKYRVMEYLKKAALSLETDGIFEGIEDARSKSARALEQILDNYDNFNISTIDSFINSILKACAINIDISPNFRIEKDYSRNLRFALDSFLRLSFMSEESKSVLLKYISQYMMSEKTGWFPKNDIYNEVEKVFVKSGNSGKKIAAGQSGFDSGLAMRADSIVKKAELFLKKFAGPEIYSNCLKAAQTAAQKRRELFYSPDKIPKAFAAALKYKKNAVPDEAAQALWDEIRNEVSRLCMFYALNYYGVYSDIYLKIDAEFEAAAKKDELVFLHDINRKAMTLFEGSGAAMPEVYYRLSEKYKHFLIDEFQDTSPVQWAGIKRFLEESLAGGGTFFYVGDAKQAIYDFRGGSWEIFYKAVSEISLSGNEAVVLDRNYRSHKTIVEFNNRVFSRENIERYLNDLCGDEESAGCYGDLVTVYSHSRQSCHGAKQKGYVEIKILDARCEDPDKETRDVLTGMIKDIAKRFSLSDITVLCRSNAEVLRAGTWLLEEGFEIESSQTLNIRNNDIIKQIVSLMKFISSPMDGLSFSSFITGEVFCAAASVSPDEMHGFIFDFRSGKKQDVFYKAFENKYPEKWNEYFERFFVQAGVAPVYELVVSVLEKFAVAENFRESKIFVMRFLELVKEFEQTAGGLENFLEYFDALENNDEGLYIKASSGGGVKIMTVHKAKGLQFPVVIVPFLKLAHANIDRPLFEDGGEKINLTYLSADIAGFCPELKSLYERQKAKTLMSEMNVFYVSMTRAECELYAIVPPKAGSSNNTAALLLGGRDIKAGSKETYAVKRFPSPAEADKSGQGYKEIKNYVKTGSGPDINEAGRRGSMLHFALSEIKSLKGKDASCQVKRACSLAKRKFLYDDTDWMEEKLLDLLGDKRIFSFFNEEENEIFNELEIVDALGNTHRMDKVIRTRDSVIVVDFKSSNAKSEENRRQVAGYADLLKEAYGVREVCGYIIDIEKKETVKV